MINSNETSLQVIENKGILKRFVNFFKKILGKDKTNYISTKNASNSNQDNKNSFLKSIKFDEDPDKAKLLKIQDELERRGINKKNALELTKDLSEEQKQKLETLYKDQIKEFELSLENYKNKIISIRKKLGA